MATKSGKNLEDIQEMNRALVIDLLRQKHLCSRIQLANATGLQRATITNIVSDLVEWGLVRETGRLVGEKGRRAVGIELIADRFRVLGVRLSHRYIDVVLADLLGNIIETQKEDIRPKDSPEQIVQHIKVLLHSFLDRQKNYRILAIGLAVPGPILFKKGRIAYNLAEFPGWERVNIIHEFENEFGIPFHFDHDANTGALAEWKYGKFARQSGSLAYISAGDGIGGGIVIDGKIQRGAQGFFGEIGHTSINFNGTKCGCGSRGCLDRYASGMQLTQEIKKALPNYPDCILHAAPKINVGSIIDAMHQGDKLATEKVREISWFLGIGIVNIINSYDPDVIIIGDELSTIGSLLIDTIRHVVKERVLPEIFENTQIELTSFKDDPTQLGSAAMALDKILVRPTEVFKPENVNAHSNYKQE